MAYETGTATSRDELLDKLRVFLVANGWNQEAWGAESTGYRLHVSKGGMYTNFRTVADTTADFWYSGPDAETKAAGLAMNLSTGYDSGASWYAQPGCPAYSSLRWSYVGVLYDNPPGAGWDVVYSYHFFENGDDVSVVLEIQPGVYRSLHWGVLDSYGSTTWYFTGQGQKDLGNLYLTKAFSKINNVHAYGTTYVLLGGTWYYTNNSGCIPPIALSYTSTNLFSAGWLASLFRVSPLDLGAHVLLPLIFSVKGSGQTYYWPVGQVKNVRAALAVHDPAEEFVLGGDTWMLFDNVERSIAIKKVVGT